MTDYGIISTGFNRKRLDQIKLEIEAQFKAVFGENLNVSPESPHGQIIGTLSESFANLWEIAEESYQSQSPSSATDAALSSRVVLNAITRLDATSSRALLDLTGTAFTVIPAGSLVSTSDTNVQFATETEVILDGGGLGSVYASAVNTGEIEAAAGTITVIDTPIAGWATVTNASDAVVGRDVETDPELRSRRSLSVARDATAIIDAIFAEISAQEGVTKTLVLGNDTNATDANGIPPHSIQAIVEGGTDADIAQAIFLKKTLGATPFGTTLVVVTDTQGINHDIYFSRPTEIDIYVTVDITTFADYPADGDDQIKQAIVDYANGELVEGREFSLGDDVIYTRLYTPINSVQGHEIDDLKIGTSPSPTGTDNIAIDIDEVSNFTVANIVVNS